MPHDFSRLRVLTVDDNRFMLKTLDTIFRALGINEIAQARNGADAMHAIRTGKPDMVFSDWDMDPVDGIELVRWVRHDPESPDIYLPFVMLTAYSEKERVVQARDQGVTDFLTKPVVPRDLYLRLVQLVDRPKPFVRTDTYFGPDRRRRDDPAYDGPERRQS